MIRQTPNMVDIALADKNNRQTLHNLMQLYLHDFSEFDDEDVDERGLFENAYLDLYWLEERRFPFMISSEGKLAGFALISRGAFHLQHNIHVEELVNMSEFFVMRKYRRWGVGRTAAHYCFNRIQGNWQVKTPANNLIAVDFWRKIIKEYTGGKFDEFHNHKNTSVAYYFTS